MTPKDFEDMLVRHEGLELKPYRDIVGKLTIGVGRNLDDNGITEDEARYLLQNDITRHALELGDAFPVVRNLDETRYYVLLNMAFNMGIPRLRDFKKMWAAIDSGDFREASRQMMDSRWAGQVGRRATELAELMANAN